LDEKRRSWKQQPGFLVEHAKGKKVSLNAALAQKKLGMGVLLCMRVLVLLAANRTTQTPHCKAARARISEARGKW
jgi:hypothetical protein